MSYAHPRSHSLSPDHTTPHPADTQDMEGRMDPPRKDSGNSSDKLANKTPTKYHVVPHATLKRVRVHVCSPPAWRSTAGHARRLRHTFAKHASSVPATFEPGHAPLPAREDTRPCHNGNRRGNSRLVGARAHALAHGCQGSVVRELLYYWRVERE